MWKENIPSTSNQILAGSSDSICDDYMLQRFIAQYDHLGTINLYVVDFENGWNRDERVDSFIFRMLDSDMEIMFEEKIDMRFCDIPGFCTVYINEEVEVGRDYYFFLQGWKYSKHREQRCQNNKTLYRPAFFYNFIHMKPPRYESETCNAFFTLLPDTWVSIAQLPEVYKNVTAQGRANHKISTYLGK